jgi:ferritin-like protein
MRDKEDEARIKAYMQAKMTHIKMYNECMNLADGLDVEKFAELVRADEREACAKVCEELGMATNGMHERTHECAQAIRARGEK